MNREEVIQAARKAFDDHDWLSADSMITLQRVARQYGEQQQLVDDVEHWLQELKNTDFERLSRPEKDEWLDEWLRRLP
jgi:hypothetical protein